MNDMAKNIVLWVIIAVVLMTVFNSFTAPKTGAPQISYSKFLEQVERKNVASVTVFRDGRVDGVMTSGSRFTTESPSDPGMVGDLLKAGVEIRAKPPEQPSILWQILINWFPLFILIGLWIFFMRQMQGGAGGRGGPMSFGKSKARLLGEDQITTTFADVAGVDEAKEDVQELVEFLRDPSKFEDVDDDRRLVAYGLKRLARRDPVRAEERLEVYAGRLLSDDEAAAVRRNVALTAARRFLPEARGLLGDPVFGEDALVTQWRVRLALRDLDWPAALDGITALPAEEREQDNWRYWWARALDETGRRKEAAPQLERHHCSPDSSVCPATLGWKQSPPLTCSDSKRMSNMSTYSAFSNRPAAWYSASTPLSTVL